MWVKFNCYVKSERIDALKKALKNAINQISPDDSFVCHEKVNNKEVAQAEQKYWLSKGPLRPNINNVAPPCGCMGCAN